MKSRVSILIINLNNLEYTKDCIGDLIQQDTIFNLTIVDQNSSEHGTSEYYSEFNQNYIKGKYNGKIENLSIIQSGFNKPINQIWNEFVSNSKTEFVCLLNNDIRLLPNFISSSIQVMDIEDSVAVVNHTTNHIDFSTYSLKLNYKIVEKPYRQGWDFFIRKNKWSPIPNSLEFFFGDDYIYSKIYLEGYKGAYVLNSPIIHYERGTTEEKKGNRCTKNDLLNYNNLNENIYFDLEYNTNYSRGGWDFSIFDLPNFESYDNIELGQTPKTTETFSNIIEEFDTIIEIGFHRGGLSNWLFKNKKPETNLYCYDITKEYLQCNEKINFIISDCLSPSSISEIKNTIKTGKKTLVLCDGGNKEIEFEIYSKFLKEGDVIMLHDYCDDFNYYNVLSKVKNWPSPPESYLNNITNSIKNNNLKPYKYYEFRNIFWGSFIKQKDIILSVLIPSLLERKDNFLKNLLNTLEPQIKDYPVEVLISIDNSKRPIGTKRNDLISQSKGKYVCFIDDDDRISDDYISSILTEIERWEPDVVVFDVEISFNGSNKKLVKYGREYDYSETNEFYFRHPNHLMVHKKDNILEKFKDIRTGEDDEWAVRMLPRIVTQSRIHKVLYYYDYNTNTKKYFNE